MGYQLGIDLGTTYTAAAVCRSSDRRWVSPEVVTLGTRTATVPSVLFLAPDGSVLFGEVAERRALTDPDRVVREFKRRIGDPTPLMVAGRAWAPEELSARLVRWVVDRVAEREGGAAERIAVTHPASWGQHKKQLLAAALAGHGLTVTFLAEPQAAALHYAAAERIAPGSTIAVYDLGGGTFDAAVVRKADAGGPAGVAGFGLLGRPEGLERLGGVDFDDAVFEHVREGMPAAFENLDDTDPAVLSAVARLRRDCTEAKEALSSDTEVSIPVMMPASRGSVRLHRSEFEAMIRPQVEETVSALRNAVRSAGLAPEQLTTVLLVGGSSRIPLVAQLVSEQLGRPIAVDADPKNGIAKGAALAISPKPTASWPDVAIAPIAGARAGGALAGGALAGGALAGGAAGGALAAGPPVRPPRGAPAGAYPPPPARSARGPVGPSHESPNTLLSTGAMPPGPPEHRPRVDPTPASDWDYEPEPAPRRNRGLLIGVGGLLAVLLVVIVGVVLYNSSSSRSQLGVDPAGGGSTTTSRSRSTQAPPVATVPGVVPATRTPGSGNGGDPQPSTSSEPDTTTQPTSRATVPTTVPKVVPPPTTAVVPPPAASGPTTNPPAPVVDPVVPPPSATVPVVGDPATDPPSAPAVAGPPAGGPATAAAV